MSSLRSGLPTPTLTENWDDDFDFEPARSAPSNTSSRMTSSSHPRVPNVLQSTDKHDSREDQRETRGIRSKVVDSWDDDFDYEPSNWTNNLKAMTEQKFSLEREAPATLSPALRSMESATSLRDATVVAHQQPNHQPSISSMSSHSTAQSNRRDRHRSSRFPSEASSSSLNVRRLPLTEKDSASEIESKRGKSFETVATGRGTIDETPTASWKSSKDRESDQGAKEGTFMGRVTSIRRRISGSLSTGPSAVSRTSSSAASKAMPPPPVPPSAFRSSSQVNTLPVLANVVPGLPRVSFDDTRKLQKKRQVVPGPQPRSDRQQEDAVSGLPTSRSSRARDSLDTVSPSQSMGGISASDSGSAPLESISGVFADCRATSPPSRYPSSSFSSPSPSIASLASHAGSYGFHLPSPAAGSAYNMFGAAFEQSVQQRQVSESSTASKSMRRASNSIRSTSGIKDTDNKAESVPKGPRTEMTMTSYREGSFQQSADNGRVTSRPDLPAYRDQTSSRLQGEEALSRTHSGDKEDKIASVPEEPPFSSRHLHTSLQAGGMVRVRGTQSETTDETSMATFRFGAKSAQETLPLIASHSAALDPQKPTGSRPLPKPEGTATGKARLTLGRIGSISRRHSRKISDGWRAISGHSTSPMRTLPSAGLSEVRSGNNGRDVSAPRPPMLSTQKPSTSQGSDLPRVATSPAFDTFGRGTSTPPRNTMLSASRPLSMVQAGASSGIQLAPTALRSLSQNDSPSTSKIGSNAVEVMSPAFAGVRPEIHPRRNSLGDLKIPSRVVSAQKGLKEEIGAMKQFAAGVQDLKALMAQHTILQAKQERLGITDTSLESEYAQWWSLADLLVQLGETGSLDGNSSGGLSNIDSTADIRRERRITLAADKVLPPSHLSRLRDDDMVLPGSSTGSLAPSLSDPLEVALSTSPRTGNARIGSLWRASTGRNDFSSSQLEQLRAILDKPKLPTIDSGSKVESIGLPPARTVAPVYVRNVKPDEGTSVQGLPRPALSSHPKQSSYELGPGIDGRQAAASQRKPSRSTMGTIRDFWKGSGESQKAATARRNPSSRQQARPSLGSIFRRSSSRVTVASNAVDNRGTATPDAQAVPVTPTVVIPDNASQSSSASDWDTPPPEDRPGATIRARPRDHRQERTNPFNPSATNEATITRSDSRKMLAVLGRAHGKSTEGSSTPLSPIRPEFQIPAFSSTTSRDSPQLEPMAEAGLTLTPASLPALVDKLRDVTEHCRVHLDVASKLLKG